MTSGIMSHLVATVLPLVFIRWGDGYSKPVAFSILVGAIRTDESDSTTFSGLIDEVRIWHSVISSQILQKWMYNFFLLQILNKKTAHLSPGINYFLVTANIAMHAINGHIIKLTVLAFELDNHIDTPKPIGVSSIKRSHMVPKRIPAL
jgi:hypothetical protein